MQSVEGRVIITPAAPPIVRPTAAQASHRGTLSTTHGQILCSGSVSIDARDDSWEGVIDEIDRPGTLATLFFGGGLRDIALLLDDGRSAAARITDARVTPDGRRSYRLEGSGVFGSRTANLRSFP